MPSDMGVCQVCGGPALPNEDVCARCRGLQQHLVNVVHDLDPHQQVEITNEGPYVIPDPIITEVAPLLELGEDLVAIVAEQHAAIARLKRLLADRDSVIRCQQYSIEQRGAIIDDLKGEINALFDSLLNALVAENGARLQLEGLREQIETLLATRPMLPPDYEWETTGILSQDERNARFDAGWDIAWVYVPEENEQDGTMRWYRPSANGHIE